MAVKMLGRICIILVWVWQIAVGGFSSRAGLSFSCNVPFPLHLYVHTYLVNNRTSNLAFLDATSNC